MTLIASWIGVDSKKMEAKYLPYILLLIAVSHGKIQIHLKNTMKE